jgi:hypothetical protein
MWKMTKFFMVFFSSFGLGWEIVNSNCEQETCITIIQGIRE